MIYVILYWIYVFSISSFIGNAFVEITKLRYSNTVLIPIIGVFIITILGSITAVFTGLSLFFELSLLLLAFLTLVKFWSSYIDYLYHIKTLFSELNVYYKFFCILIIVLCAIKSASIPFILDNETYYIQSIKWLDHFGFVPGLANLHLFLSQTSGWHITHSALNLDFINSGFNDLNGFFLVLANFYAMVKISTYFKYRNLYLLIPGLLPIFYVLIFQFVSSPSPDLPIYILTIIIIGEFLKALESKDRLIITELFLLSIFAIFIKITAIFLMIFPIILVIQKKYLLKNELFTVISVSFLSLTLFVIKNSIISGYPIYPLSYFDVKDVSWLLPREMLDYIVDSTNSYGFLLNIEEYNLKSQLELFLIWIALPGLHGYFNKLMIILIILFPLVIYFSKSRKQFAIIYSVSVLQFLVLCLTSPQYRFFLGFMIILIMIILAQIFKRNDRFVNISFNLSVIAIIIPLFFSFELTSFSKNEFHQQLSGFNSKNLIRPYANSKYSSANFERIELDDNSFFTPKNIDFFWAVGDCPLPCIQLDQYNYFKYYFKIVPVPRSKNLEDGFYSKKLKPFESK